MTLGELAQQRRGIPTAPPLPQPATTPPTEPLQDLIPVGDATTFAALGADERMAQRAAIRRRRSEQRRPQPPKAYGDVYRLYSSHLVDADFDEVIINEPSTARERLTQVEAYRRAGNLAAAHSADYRRAG